MFLLTQSIMESCHFYFLAASLCCFPSSLPSSGLGHLSPRHLLRRTCLEDWRTGFTREFVRNSECSDSLSPRKSQNLHFNELPRWSAGTLIIEDHWARLHKLPPSILLPSISCVNSLRVPCFLAHRSDYVTLLKIFSDLSIIYWIKSYSRCDIFSLSCQVAPRYNFIFVYRT